VAILEVTKFEHKVYKVHEVQRSRLAVVAFTPTSSHHSGVIGAPTPCNHPLVATEPYDSDESIDDAAVVGVDDCNERSKANESELHHFGRADMRIYHRLPRVVKDC